MPDTPRARRIAERIKVIVAEYLENRVKDDRLGFVTVTDVRVTGDLQHASIFYTFFGSDEERTASGEVLEAYRGRIRSAVGKGVGTRLTPSIEFIPDALPEGAAHVEELLAEAKRRDAELAAAASTAGYAGDADPYRRDDREDHPDDGRAEDGLADEGDDAGDADRPDDADGGRARRSG